MTGPAALQVGVLRETAPGERRVALTPDGVTRLVRTGLTVLVESGAGAAAWFTDAAYTAAGARVTNRGAADDVGRNAAAHAQHAGLVSTSRIAASRMLKWVLFVDI